MIPAKASSCGLVVSVELEQVVPYIAAGAALWHWHLEDSWLQERLRRATAFDPQEQQSQDQPA